jgi:c-di-GMP-related signal transduction protein
MLDVMLAMPMSDILEKIPLDSETKAVLLGKPSPLRSIYQLLLAHESGEWSAVQSISESLHLDPDIGAASYWQAQQWAREVSSGA